MAEKQNCWEVKNCGRELGGEKVSELGTCPAATESAPNSLNGGRNGGRICWAVTGTLCGGKVQGTFAQKHASCLSCEFFRQVQDEEADAFVMEPERVST